MIRDLVFCLISKTAHKQLNPEEFFFKGHIDVFIYYYSQETMSVTSHSQSRSALDDESIPGFTKPGTKSSLVGKIGNLSVQYNLGAASIAVVVMNSLDDTILGSSSSGSGSAGSVISGSGSSSSGDFPEPSWAQYTLLGTVFFGAVVGMLSMGYLGDVLGRRKAMLITLGLVVLGATGSGVFPWGSTGAMYAVITACRFLVGMGVGGIYPLSAVQSAENAEENDDTESQAHEQTASRIGWAFFWQVPGQVLPYLVCLILLLIHLGDESFGTSAQFRIIFVIGMLVVLCFFFFFFFFFFFSIPTKRK